MTATGYSLAALLLASIVPKLVLSFTVSDPPMPIKWPIVGTLPDFLARGGVDNLPGIYEVSWFRLFRHFHVLQDCNSRPLKNHASHNNTGHVR